jgi:hypothetical protein
MILPRPKSTSGSNSNVLFYRSHSYFVISVTLSVIIDMKSS